MSDDGDAKTLLQQAIHLHREGELTKAERAYRQVLESEPEQPDALYLLGIIAHQMGNSGVAIERMRKSLAIRPGHLPTLFNLGRVYAETEQVDEAIACYEEVLRGEPEDAEAHRSLGHLLTETGRLEEGLARYRRVLELLPDDALARGHIAQTLEEMNRWEEAIAEYLRIVIDHPDTFHAYRRAGNLLRKLHQLDKAAVVYEQWLEREPDSAVARHLLAACRGDEVPERASDEYVRATFDGFAEEFDECLRELRYRVPEVLEEVLKRLIVEPQQNLAILDLGCGTGLCGPKLRPYASYLAGLDLSPAMLNVARQREIYDKLYDAELTEFLHQRDQEYDLIVSGDTLNYLGDLNQPLRGACRALRSGGGILFTLEQWNDPDQRGYRLNEFGRYMHGRAYLERTVEDAGLQLFEITEQLLRYEGGQGVIGWFVVAFKPSPTG